MLPAPNHTNTLMHHLNSRTAEPFQAVQGFCNPSSAPTVGRMHGIFAFLPLNLTSALAHPPAEKSQSPRYHYCVTLHTSQAIVCVHAAIQPGCIRAARLFCMQLCSINASRLPYHSKP
jgi:hypothetical protein